MAKSSTSSASSSSVASSDSTAALPASYEAALQELEALVASLESGQLPLDQLLTGYQRGAQLLKFCRDKLEAVETQIKVLEGTEPNAKTPDYVSKRIAAIREQQKQRQISKPTGKLSARRR